MILIIGLTLTMLQLWNTITFKGQTFTVFIFGELYERLLPKCHFSSYCEFEVTSEQTGFMLICQDSKDSYITRMKVWKWIVPCLNKKCSGFSLNETINKSSFISLFWELQWNKKNFHPPLSFKNMMSLINVEGDVIYFSCGLMRCFTAISTSLV